MKTSILLAVFAIMVIALIAGCSSSGDSYSPPPTGGAVAGGGCGRFSSESTDCPVIEASTQSAEFEIDF